jgi:hypothetical protein
MSATDDLAILDQRHAEAVEGRRRVDEEERAAFDSMREAEADLERLLTEKMRGDEPPPRLLADAQKRLDRAREATRREWSLERRASDRVVLEAARQRHAFIEQHVDALLAAEREEAQAHADEMNQLAHRVIEVHAQLLAAERRAVALVHVGYPNKERLVRAPRSSSFAQAAQQLVAAGGERPPTFEPQVVAAVGEAS